MKHIFSALMAAMLIFCFTGCAGGDLSAAPLKSEQEKGGSEMEQNVFYLTISEKTFTAFFAENSAAQALRKLLVEGPLVISMSDYGGFEKVGALGQNLPASDAHMTTKTGDIVLYQRNQIVLFYGSNSWSYTRLGKVSDLTGWTNALGRGDLSVTFSLTKP